MKAILSSGVWGVLATPFTPGGAAIDLESLSRLIDHNERCGVEGVVLLGVFGEAATLDAAERATVLGVAAEFPRLPIVVGVTPLATAPCIDEAHRAREELGDQLAAVMLQVNSADPDVVAEHVVRVAEAADATIVLQHYPEAGGRQLSTADLVRAATSAASHLAAVKSECNPTIAEVHALTTASSIPVFGGLGGTGLLDELQLGSAGAMTGFSCPEGLVACVRAYQTSGLAAARAALLPYLPLVNFEFQRVFALAIRKQSLRLRGLIDCAHVRRPGAPLPDYVLPLLRQHLEHALSTVTSDSVTGTLAR